MTMEKIRNTQTTVMFDHKFIANLATFDGPLESLFRDAEGRLYLYCWFDADSQYNRWIVVRIEKPDLKRYLFGEISLMNILTKPRDGILYLIDIDNRMIYDDVYSVKPKDLPPACIPDTDSFYSFEEFGYDDLAKRLQLLEKIWNDPVEYKDVLNYMLRKVLENLLHNKFCINKSLRPVFNLFPLTTWPEFKGSTMIDFQNAKITSNLNVVGSETGYYNDCIGLSGWGEKPELLYHYLYGSLTAQYTLRSRPFHKAKERMSVSKKQDQERFVTA